MQGEIQGILMFDIVASSRLTERGISQVVKALHESIRAVVKNEMCVQAQ
jgi:hypothetical protein